MTTEALCSHRPPCPGCPRFADPAPPPEAWQALQQLARESELPEPKFHSLAALGHRHRARLAVRGRARSPKIGLFQSGSHRIVDTPNCGVHHPRINETVSELKQAIRETGIAPYADTPHLGALRYVQIVVERSSQRVQVVLVGNGTEPEVLGKLPSALASRLGDRLSGLFFNGQPERSNAILGPNTLRLEGEAAVLESLGGVDVFFPPAAFGQNHLPLFERAIDHITELVPDQARIAEYYCGVGAIGLSLLSRAKEVVFNERSPHGLAGLELGIAARPPAEQARARIQRGPAGDFTSALADQDVVILDPPRKGLDAPLLQALRESPPKRLIYLACGLPSLLRELPSLVRDGPFRIAGLAAFDFFPFTEHLETLVWLDRNGETQGRTETTPSPPSGTR